RYYVEQRLALFDELDRENRTLIEAVRAQVASNRSQPADIIAPKEEAAQLADRRDDVVRDLAKSRAELRRFIGQAADEPLTGIPPQLDIDPDRLRMHLHHHPDIAIFDSLTRKTEAEVREAEAAKESDWGVAVAYQRRSPLYSDMVSVQFTFDLPIFPETRQDPRIAAKKEELGKISAEKAAMLRDHIAEFEKDLADYTATSHQLDRIKNTWLPLAREKYVLRLNSYRAGKTEIGEVVNARQEWIEQRLKAIDLKKQTEQAAARLRFAYGEDMQ
ncbi:MAG: TolC family protein, partial [Burkholderiales bacterium]